MPTPKLMIRTISFFACLLYFVGLISFEMPMLIENYVNVQLIKIRNWLNNPKKRKKEELDFKINIKQDFLL